MLIGRPVVLYCIVNRLYYHLLYTVSATREARLENWDTGGTSMLDLMLVHHLNQNE